jgi:hypothetical protein
VQKNQQLFPVRRRGARPFADGLGPKRILMDPHVLRLVVDYLTGTVENAAGVHEETRVGMTAGQMGSRQ